MQDARKEFQDKALFVAVCSECDIKVYVHAPQDSDSNLSVATCPNCDGSLLAYSTELSQANRKELTRHVLNYLQDRLLARRAHSAIEKAMRDVGIQGVSLEQMRQFLEIVSEFPSVP